MAEHTKIEWTDATWNPVTGCSVVSPGCTNCYAMRLAGTRLKHHPSRAGLTRDSKAGPVWTGEVRFIEAWLTQPLQWKRPRTVFVCAHGDLFHEEVPDAWIDQVFAVMALSPQHTFQVLTKRSDRMRAYMDRGAGRIADATIALRRTPLAVANGLGPTAVVPLPHVRPGAPWWPLPNVWLGVSAEDQRRADERVPGLLATPAAVRFVSAEPLLGPIDFNSTLGGTLWIGGQRGCDGMHRHGGRAGEVIHGILHETDPRQLHHHHDERCGRGLDWIIAGGESGRGARPMHPDWARQIRDQCAAAGTAFFFKQWGLHCPGSYSESRHTALLDASAGPTHGVVLGAPPHANVHEWGDGWISIAAGKKAAGRLLDGVEHNAMPRVA